MDDPAITSGSRNGQHRDGTVRHFWSNWLTTCVRTRHWAKLSGRAQAVLIAIAVHADKDGKCWPAIEHLSGLAGHTTARNTAYAINELKQAGLIQRIRRARGMSAITVLVPIPDTN